MGHVVKGIILLLAACYMLLKRREDPEKTPGLRAFQDQLGERTGSVIHLLVTTVFPVIVALWILADGFGLLRTSYAAEENEPLDDPSWTPERAAKFQADLAKAREEGDDTSAGGSHTEP